ncbi:IS110 family transposase [Sphingomonas sp. RP10(2022)]|uniref:IS110 family transposase n=1 Tax=Sphingomonas liriopis TaxID=2949094 RepID=A0A9X2KRB5_9SPHN|nr:IS110 family transposase [Sphingomonas liriopis]MCP3736599.1 IS110 family transposase [Sphingomonas liriopis]
MAHNSMVVAGIDTGKMWLDIACHPSGQAIRVENDDAGHIRAAGWLAEHGVRRVGLEASGGYERGVTAALRRAGFAVAVLQPRQVRAFALFRLKLAKNDRLDAALIACCTAELDDVRAAPDPRLEPLAEHLRLIEQLEGDLARARTRAEAFHQPRHKRALQREAERLARRVKAELLLLGKAVAAQADLARRLALVESVQGIGRRTALALLVLMPELGRLSRGEAASLAGLAPFDRDSGQYRGQRRIQGGRHRVRRALYAAALPASFRWNKALVDTYQRLRGAGKNHKQALTACARKLLIYANTVLARQAEWMPAS